LLPLLRSGAAADELKRRKALIAGHLLLDL
jgi:hypothetical protein